MLVLGGKLVLKVPFCKLVLLHAVNEIVLISEKFFPACIYLKDFCKKVALHHLLLETTRKMQAVDERESRLRTALQVMKYLKNAYVYISCSFQRF